MPSRPSLHVGTDRITQAVTGLAQVPATGVRAVLVHLVATAGDASAKLYAWTSGTSRPTAHTLYVGAGQTQFATVLIRVGTDGAMKLQSDVPGLTVSVLSVGYVAA